MSDAPPTRLPLVATSENRGVEPDVDARLINGYVEKSAMGDLWCRKRPGYTLSDAVGTPGKTAGGIHAWGNNIYSIFGNEFYKDGVYIAAVDGLEAAGYTFSSTMAATPQLFFHNDASAYTYDSGAGVVAVADPNYPSATVRGSVYLDGTTYVMTEDCYILGSAINDPTSWDPLNSIRAQIEPSAGVAIAKQMSYVIVFKEHTTEVFYNAQNAAGSPLGRVEGAQFNYGCYTGTSIVDINGALFYIGQSQVGTINVMKLERLKYEVISTPAVERLLQGNFTSVGVRATCLYSGGHTFYVLSAMLGVGTTLVYDVGEKLWSIWTDTTGDSFPIVSATKRSTAAAVGQGYTDGNIYTISSEVSIDEDGPFTFELYTPNWDAGSRLQKTANILEINADQRAAGVLQIRYSDDDYQTWSNFRSVDLSEGRPMLSGLGTFRRRAHHLRHRGPTALRLRSLDLHVDLGTL